MLHCFPTSACLSSPILQFDQRLRFPTEPTRCVLASSALHRGHHRGGLGRHWTLVVEGFGAPARIHGQNGPRLSRRSRRWHVTASHGTAGILNGHAGCTVAQATWGQVLEELYITKLLGLVRVIEVVEG